MKTLIQSARIISPGSPHNGKKRDVLVETIKAAAGQGSRILAIGADIDGGNAKIINGKGLCLSHGWIDMQARFCDPGAEYKEDLISGIQAAIRGGFSHVVLMPSNTPVSDNKGAIEYIISRSSGTQVKILPAGTLSENLGGKQLSEMFDMHSAGAVAFTDDKQPVSTELMTRALEYASNFGGLIISFPYDQGLHTGGLIHEGPTSVSLGLKGIPSLSEELRLQRDIELLRYTGGRLHVSLVSAARSIDLIRRAKKDKLNITCGIAAHQLSFTDSDLASFDSNLKVMPPFRGKEDRKAMIAGLRDGTIDVICSDHTPEDPEHKVREFEDASPGISGIESAFCAVFTSLTEHLETANIIDKLTTGPASVLGMTIPAIEEGTQLSLTVFSTDESTLFSKSSWKSKSVNSPFMEQTLRGKVLATF